MKTIRNRWGKVVSVGDLVSAHHPRGGTIDGTVIRLARMSGYGARAELDSGHSCSVDDVISVRRVVGTLKRKRPGRSGGIAFQPKHEIRGELVRFTKDLFANQEYPKEWFVAGYSTGGEYGGHYIRRVAWPKDQHKRKGGFSRVVGWKTKREAARAAKILTRFVRMGKVK